MRYILPQAKKANDRYKRHQGEDILDLLNA